MEQLRIIGNEDGSLVLAAENGARFTLEIDDVLRAEIRKARQGAADERTTPRASPREIQAHFRSGLSAAEVAELLGTSVDDVERYEGPVVAEREHVIGQALAVPVLMGGELEPDGSLSFGAAIRAKLAEAGAADERWSSWKDESGWVVKLEFTANEIHHDARWSFDPRRSTLSPQNADATQLSRQGSLPEGLIPRLRAVEPSTTNTYKDDSRFDSGAFGPRRLPDPEPVVEQPARPVTAQDAAIKRAPEPAAPTNPETADLLEALRRRRGQREPLPGSEERSTASEPVSLFDEAPPAPESTADEAEAASAKESGRRRGRPSMPSWDDIVFGARSDD